MTLDFCLRLEPNDLCRVMSVMSCPALSWPLMVGLSTWSAFQVAKLANASSEWRTVLKTPQNQQNYVLMSKMKIKNCDSGGVEGAIAPLMLPCQNNSLKSALLDRPMVDSFWYSWCQFYFVCPYPSNILSLPLLHCFNLFSFLLKALHISIFPHNE